MSAAFNPLLDHYKSFHQTTTDIDVTRDISHESRKASIINGNVFYLPNSMANVALPLPVHDNSKIWWNSKLSSSNVFLQPLWWSAETAYLAFFSTYPHLCGEPFAELLDVPDYFDHSKAGYILDPQILLKWKWLEHFLRRITGLLIGFSHAVDPKPVIGTALSCAGVYKTARSFRCAVKWTRNWFSVWMAQVSYAIAIAVSAGKHSEHPDDIPLWCQFLLRRDFQFEGWDQAYISGIRQSMGRFSPSILHSGIFLQIISPPQHQFSVDWFQGFHVPVWYPWGKKETNVARASCHVARLAPPPEKLQDIATFLSKVPQTHATKINARTLPNTYDQHPWIAFLAARADCTKKAIEQETSQEQQARESRERKPPKHQMKVFIWQPDGESKNGYRRELVSKKNNEHTLSMYSSSQRIYNSILNEWDCYEEPDDETSDLDDDFDSHNTYGPDAQFNHADIMPSLFQATSNLPTSSEGLSGGHASSSSSLSSSQHQILPSLAEVDYEPVYYDAFELLQDFLGFVPPLPLPVCTSTHGGLSGDNLQILLSVVGLRECRPECPSVDVSADIWNFLEAWNKPKSSNGMIAHTSIWDLAPGNRRYLAGRWHIHYLHILDGEIIRDNALEKLYLFDFGRRATVPWSLAVTNVIDALFVCRLDDRMDDYKIAKHLLTRGIHFRTFVRDTLPPLKDLPISFTPFRFSGYIFNLWDYDVYIRECDALLHNPRVARAALMKGGIVWHLIVSSMSISEVLSGPSAATSLYHYGLALAANNGGCHLWNDIVSQEELDQICGTYFCYTGKGSQYSIKSWWPTFSVWTTNVHTTYWSDFAEKKFQECLGEIVSGKAQPRTATEWCQWIRGSSHARRITMNIADASDHFLQTFLFADPTMRYN